jgi:hypothetical protein
MAVSAALIRPGRVAHASLVKGGVAFAAALGGSEAVYRVIGPFWGAVCFAVTFLAIVQLAMLQHARGAADRKLTALIAVASLVPLARLLAVSVPALPFLRLYPNALWILPMGVTSVYAYRTPWLQGTRLRLLHLSGPGWRPFAVQASVVLAGAGLGVLAAYTLPYTGPHVLTYPDSAKWIGAVLFALAGGVEELAWRGVLQRITVDAVGPIGIAACLVVSAYVTVAWMGFVMAVPVIALSALTSVVVYRTRCLAGSVAGHTLLNLLLVMLR